jgi:hypothetical protein
MPAHDPYNNPYLNVDAAQILPVYCPSCGYSDNLHRPDRWLRHAVLERTVLDELKEELALLNRAERLFERFPEGHQLIETSIDRLLSGRWPSVKEIGNPALVEALDADPELKQFLESRMFSLPGRGEYVQGQVEEIEKDAREDPVFQAACPACQRDALRLERTFYDGL